MPPHQTSYIYSAEKEKSDFTLACITISMYLHLFLEQMMPQILQLILLLFLSPQTNNSVLLNDTMCGNPIQIWTKIAIWLSVIIKSQRL